MSGWGDVSEFGEKSCSVLMPCHLVFICSTGRATVLLNVFALFGVGMIIYLASKIKFQAKFRILPKTIVTGVFFLFSHTLYYGSPSDCYRFIINLLLT